MTRVWLLLFVMLSPTVACAQSAPGAIPSRSVPGLIPSRSVTVTYRVSGAAVDRIPGGAPNGVQVAWDAVEQRLRVEAVGQPNYALVALHSRVLDMVFGTQRAYLELPIRGGDPQTLLTGRDVHFTRRGSDHVAGLDCTEWAFRSHKLEGVGCVTPDGVVLRAHGTFEGQPGEVVATTVAYGEVNGPDLLPPADFFRLMSPLH